jgi:hypothetical protein
VQHQVDLVLELPDEVLAAPAELLHAPARRRRWRPPEARAGASSARRGSRGCGACGRRRAAPGGGGSSRPRAARARRPRLAEQCDVQVGVEALE